ncbi:MAG: hypothetical protein Q7J16_04120 [Candidatus Cloacimonadales bacterium]|nr:hypothetical protein [Candidatus Cloacimonadales bacterium]
MRNYLLLIILAGIFWGCQKKELEKTFIAESESKPISEEQKTITNQDSIQKEQDTTIQPKNDEKWLSTDKLWALYNDSKAKVKAAEEKKDYEEMSKFSYEAAIYANALERTDIEAWQYNNAAFYLIEAFKAKTDYEQEMAHLNSLELKTEILDYREKMKKKFHKEKRLLSKAVGYLQKAQEIDGTLDVSERTTVIANNQQFVEEILNLLE